jgi:hypothetical protein
MLDLELIERRAKTIHYKKEILKELRFQREKILKSLSEV